MPRQTRQSMKMSKKPLDCLKIKKEDNKALKKESLPLTESFRQRKRATLTLKNVETSNETKERSLPEEQDLKTEVSYEGETPTEQDSGCFVDQDVESPFKEEVAAEEAEEEGDTIDPYQCSKEEAFRYLHGFDFMHRFGPCSSITRTERFKRATHYSLNPPQNVKILIERFCKEDPNIDSNVWSRYVI